MTRKFDAIEAAAWYAARSCSATSTGAHAKRARELGREPERARRAAGDRRAGAGELGSLGRHVHQRMQRERLVRRELGKTRRARAVADERPAGDVRGGVGDLSVGHAQQDGIGAEPVRAASERPGNLVARPRQSAGKRGTDPAPADDGQARASRRVRGELPFQFPHLRYRSASEGR